MFRSETLIVFLPVLDVDRFVAALKKLAAFAEAKSVFAAEARVDVDADWKPIEKALRSAKSG